MNKNVLGVIKSDMDEVSYRLNAHQEDYMRVFSTERTRKHFDEIFFSRYYSITGSDLALIPASFLGVVSKFYHEVKNLFLYLKMTEDMPSAVTNKLLTELKIINDAYDEFCQLYLTYSGDEVVETEEEGEGQIFEEPLLETSGSNMEQEEADDFDSTPSEKLNIDELEEAPEGQNIDGPPPFDKE